jgi:hypothetical protein
MDKRTAKIAELKAEITALTGKAPIFKGGTGKHIVYGLAGLRYSYAGAGHIGALEHLLAAVKDGYAE